jgi:rare lipoprotein A
VSSRLTTLTLLATLVLMTGCASAPRRAERRPAPDNSAVPDSTSVPDAVPRVEPRSNHGNPAFYDVAGQRYVVLTSAAGFVERGVASWYGPDFHGKSTSSGETYDMYAMTAAHKTLPIPCYARVTNLGNGRSVIVRINDRGPFVSGRIVDLSYTAAARLDMLRNGTAFVELAVLTPERDAASGAPLSVQAAELPTPPDLAGQHLYVQVGAFADSVNAMRLQDSLRAAGIATVSTLPAAGRSALTRVRIGPLATVSDYDALLPRLLQLGIRDAKIIGE